MVRHRASRLDRVRTWWDERSLNPLFLPVVWVVLSALLLLGLALTIPPIIDNITTPKEPEQTTQQPTETPEPTLPPVLQVPSAQPSPETTQGPVPTQGPQPVAPEPQVIPQPVAPQPVPVQPFRPQPVPVAPKPVPQVPQPQPVLPVPLPPVLPLPQPVLPLPSLPTLPSIVENPVGAVGGIVKGTAGTVDQTVEEVVDTLTGILP